MKSVVHVNDTGGCFGGTEEYLGSVSEAMARGGIASYLVYGEAFGDLPSSFAGSVGVDGLADRACPPEVSERVLSAIRPLRPDAVYLHNLFDGATVRAACERPRRHAVWWYVHDHAPTCLAETRTRRSAGGRPEPCTLRLGPACLEHAAHGTCVLRFADARYRRRELVQRAALLDAVQEVDAVIVVSSYMRRLLVEHLPGISSRVHVVPFPVAPVERLVQRRPSGEITIHYGARLIWEKGLHVALEALRELGPIRVSLRLRAAGAGGDSRYEERCRELAARAQRANPRLTVEFIGHVVPERMCELYAAADIAVTPSVWPEPLGVAVGEAMLAGLPAVASNVGGIDTWIEHQHDGILVPPGDPQALASALGTLIDDGELRDRLGQTARAAVARRFTMRRHLEVLAAIQSAIAAERGAVSAYR